MESVSSVDEECAISSRPMEQLLNLDRDIIDDAVCAIPQNHQDYLREALCDLLRQRYLGTPSNVCVLFVNVATSSPQYVAGIEKIASTFGGSGYLPDDERAKRAARSLTSWRCCQHEQKER